MSDSSGAATVDVIEVELAPPNLTRVMGRCLTEANAEAYIAMAVARRGVETSFYATAPVGVYDDGDEWHAHHQGGRDG